MTKQRPACCAAIIKAFVEHRVQVTAYQIQAMTMQRNGGNHINSPEFNITDIVAVEPFYGENGGNATRIHYRQGQVITEKFRMKTYLQRLSSHFEVNLVKLRQVCGRRLCCTQSVPLPFAPFLVLVPLKMRTPLFATDGAMGYVNIDSVKEIKNTGNVKDHTSPKCIITFEGGSSVPSLYSRKITEKNLKKGVLARDYFCSAHRQDLVTDNIVVKERMRSDNLETLVNISRLLYELLNEKDKARNERMNRLLFYDHNWKE